VVDVSAEHVLAWLWHGDSYEQLDAFVKSDGDSVYAAFTVPGSHSRFTVFGTKLPLIDDRVVATWSAWDRARNGDLVVAFTHHTGTAKTGSRAKKACPSAAGAGSLSKRNEGVSRCGGSGLLRSGVVGGRPPRPYPS
jgi:hypothetical protein